ncbi:M48 family metalloprotease [Roseateles sp. P5_E11]
MIRRQPQAREALLLSLGAEIWVHVGVFAVIAVPIVAVGLPVVLVTFATYEVFQSIGALWNGAKDPGVQVAYGWLTVFVAVLLLARFIAGSRNAVRADAQAQAELADRGRQPKGVAGQVLCETVSRLWQAARGPEKAAPEVVWYSGFQVAAHARTGVEGDCIFVSSALWDRVAKRDLTGDLILAHEMGHIVHRDSRAFRRLSIMLGGIRSTLALSKAFAVAASVVILVSFTSAGLIHGEPRWWLLRLGVATVSLASLCFLLLVIGDLFVRRYASFIVALMEVRADLCAALWTVGLEKFAKHLASDAALHRSTAGDLAQSFLSPNMTHISESERLALIRTPERLFTPKLRYFAWSVVLALLLPLNPITPLLLNGAVDHAILVCTVSALYASAMTMLVLGGFNCQLGWKRAVVLATAACGALGITSINFYEIGYLLTHYGIALANGTGFSQVTVTLTEMGSDTLIVARALARKAGDGLSGWWFLVSVPLTAAAMKMIRPAVRSLPLQGSKLALTFTTAVTTFCVALIAGRDPRRSELYDMIFGEIPDDWWLLVEPVRLAVPAWVALLSVLVTGALLKLGTRETPAPERSMAQKRAVAADVDG